MASALVAFATATVSTAAASTAVAASAAARWPSLPRARLIHRQWPAFHGMAVQFGDRILGLLFRGHSDKSKATRFAGEFILHESNFLHYASLREKLLQFVFGGVEWKIAYV